MEKQMTLRELCTMLPSTIGVKKPGKTTLLEGGQVVASYEGSDLHLSVFSNGFALAESGRRWAVIRIEKCLDYDYEVDDFQFECDDATPHQFDFEYFLDQPWMIRIGMAAGYQLEMNNDCNQRRLIARHTELGEEIPWMAVTTESFEDAVLNGIVLREAIENLTERQRQVFLLSERGFKQREIAELYGISQAAVNRLLSKAITNLTKQLD